MMFNGLIERFLKGDSVNRKTLSLWLESASKHTGFPGFVVAIIALIVSSFSLFFVIAGYRLQAKSDRPILGAVSSRMSFSGLSTIGVAIGWNNIGKQTVRRGTATLFGLPEGAKAVEK